MTLTVLTGQNNWICVSLKSCLKVLFDPNNSFSKNYLYLRIQWARKSQSQPGPRPAMGKNPRAQWGRGRDSISEPGWGRGRGEILPHPRLHLLTRGKISVSISTSPSPIERKNPSPSSFIKIIYKSFIYEYKIKIRLHKFTWKNLNYIIPIFLLKLRLDCIWLLRLLFCCVA